jgi:molybdenum cofactor cytidylyltransferase
LSESSGFPVAAIVLAAGAAIRMGRLKQLLCYRGRTLVQHAVEQVIGAGFDPVIVVVGAEAAAVRLAVAAQRVLVVENERWGSGMGSSVAAGVGWLQQAGRDSEAVAILLTDQPLVTSAHLIAMSSLLQTSEAPILAAEYAGMPGVPALFRRVMFPALAALKPEAGARQILRDSGVSVVRFPLPEAAVDVDTPEDFETLEMGPKIINL